MFVRRVAIENVRSFLGRAELHLEDKISILIGPNGGGKTNLLDTAVIVLRRYLFASMYAASAPTAEQPERHEFRPNDALNSMILEKHSRGQAVEQVVELDIEVTDVDITNIARMKAESEQVFALAKRRFTNAEVLMAPRTWNLASLSAGQRITFIWRNGAIQPQTNESAIAFAQYLNLFEIDGLVREENDLATLSMPLVYLPVSRAAGGFASNVQLANYNPYDQKRSNDAAYSRSGLSIISLAIGRMAQRYRLLLEQDKGMAAQRFRDEPSLIKLTNILANLGYEWELASINPLRNEYDIRLRKQGSAFLVGSASSGERELLTYLFAIFALNVRDALILVDEPELHLHPKWQTVLLSLFETLSDSTKNQFVLATHSPTFVSPQSIQYVSRVYSHHQASKIIGLDATSLPNRKHLFNLVNSQNNERIFFADAVILVEGMSDRIFFEAVLKAIRYSDRVRSIIEVVSVGGKGLFAAYQALLAACQIKHFVVADFDYLEQIGDESIKRLFATNAAEIKKDVLENVKSLDGNALIKRIDDALSGGSISDARDVWDYIRAHRRHLRPGLSASDEGLLDAFIARKKDENVFVLRHGSLEDYLPDGHRSKDLEKLIEFLVSDTFWSALPVDRRTEIELITDQMLLVIGKTEQLVASQVKAI
ncbi:AAA family ATPase [Bradyrhizobium vignae]|uniref:AAA family ATPase n=1 Tax=Bradyrhizobium vignae TaxID=1549949 RepID=A0ABS4A769_9BRAD|nr:AAA family ATPase [Bradyrhizobium vignae]MBP0116270.1 AAA family ATPase [Bradyrhizobium vignae]